MKTKQSALGCVCQWHIFFTCTEDNDGESSDSLTVCAFVCWRILISCTTIRYNILAALKQ